MKRRANGEGNISRRKDGRYQARLWVTLPDGTRRRKYIYGKSREEVSVALTEALAERNRGFVYDDTLAFGTFLDQWLDSAQHTIKATSYEAYERAIRVHVAPALGDIKLAKLTPGTLQSYYARKLAAGLSPATVRLHHATIHRALAMALKWRLVRENVADAVDPPQPRAEEIRPLSPEQARIFLDAVRGTKHEALFVVATTIGARIGEILGLKWSDLDLDAGTLRIERTLSTAKSGPRFTTPKSGRGRNIKLPALALDALKKHRATQNAQRLALGDAWHDLDLIFPARDGSPLNRNHLVNDHFAPLLRRAALPQIRFHDLRHTTATLLLSQGVHPKLVQELLGHASISLTLDTYSHVLPSLGDVTAVAMDTVLS